MSSEFTVKDMGERGGYSYPPPATASSSEKGGNDVVVEKLSSVADVGVGSGG